MLSSYDILMQALYAEMLVWLKIEWLVSLLEPVTCVLLHSPLKYTLENSGKNVIS